MNNENEKNNQEPIIGHNKSNTFNLVIGLATLIIAILGATFAYFTMTGGSAENEITVQSAYVSISYDGGTKVEANDLIPTSENVMLWAYQERVKETYKDPITQEDKTYQCVDKNGRKVCYVYQFTVRSDDEGETPTTILGTITVNHNEFIETINDMAKSGLSYMVYELTQDGEENTVYTKVSANSTSSINQDDIYKYGDNNDDYKFVRFGIPTINDNGGEITTESITNYLFGDDGYTNITNRVDHTYQLVIWLHDDNYNQNNEQAKAFAGTINISVNSGDNVGNVTGQKQ